MLWGCVAGSGTGKLAMVEGRMNSAVYQAILESNVPESVNKLKLGRGWILQQDNDPKHQSNSTKEYMRKKEVEGT
jgi:hypothetical protein